MTTDLLAPALARACTDLNARAEFYHLLLNTPVYALGEKHERKLFGKTLPAMPKLFGQTILLQHWQREDNGGEVIPFFSSLPLLEQAITTATPYVQVTGLDILRASGDTPLILNPFSETNKEFLPDEVDVLRLDGLASVLVTDNKGKPTSHLLAGIPKNLPRVFVHSLAERLKRHDAIDAAYIAQTLCPDDGSVPRLTILLSADTKTPNLLTELHTVFTPLLPPDRTLELVWLNDGHPLQNYLINETSPIYRQGMIWDILGRLEQKIGL